MFAFEEGVVVKALKEGLWLLLDEINMAPEDCLDRLYSIAESQGVDLNSD